MTDPRNRASERGTADSRTVEVLVPAIVETRMPDRDLVEIEPLGTGGRRTTAVCRFATGPALVVQLTADTDAVRTEAALIRAIRGRTSLPAPPVVASGVLDGSGYLVSEHRDGADLHTAFAEYDGRRQRRIAREFGRYLGELHAAFAFGACGEVSLDDGTLTATGPECGRWLDDSGRAAVERLPSAFDGVRDRLLAVLERAPETGATPRLFPWDLRPGNALAVDGEISAVVDWERPMAAPAALAVAKTEYLVADWYVDDPAPLRAAFRDGYAEVRTLPPVRPVHRVVAIADSAVDSHGVVTRPGYPERRGDAATAFHRAALRRVCPE